MDYSPGSRPPRPGPASSLLRLPDRSALGRASFSEVRSLSVLNHAALRAELETGVGRVVTVIIFTSRHLDRSRRSKSKTRKYKIEKTKSSKLTHRTCISAVEFAWTHASIFCTTSVLIRATMATNHRPTISRIEAASAFGTQQLVGGP